MVKKKKKKMKMKKRNLMCRTIAGFPIDNGASRSPSHTKDGQNEKRFHFDFPNKKEEDPHFSNIFK